MSIVTAKGFIPQQLDITAAFLYGSLEQTFYLHLPQDYSDGNRVAHLKTYLSGLK
jgi:hypothetical protein